MNANVISRARGQSIVSAAAYRAGARLRDHRYGVVHNYVARRGGGGHAEIMAPAGAPDWVRDRETLWNRVEAAELRRDSQLARVIELSLPNELSADETLLLVREYIALMFVAQGMVADFSIRRDNPNNPQAHILLTLRCVTQLGFGPKERRWNGRAKLIEWRCAWADCANVHLARAGLAVRIDHRTLEAQQIELMPARRIGIGRALRDDKLPDHLAARIAEQRHIDRANGDAIVADPSVALRALTQQSPSFSQADLERFLRSRTDGDAQFAAALEAVMQSFDMAALTTVDGVAGRFTSRDMIEAAASLRRRVASMAGRHAHAMTSRSHSAVLGKIPLNDAMTHACETLLAAGDCKALTLADDAATARLLDAVSAAWSAAGLAVVRVTPRTLAEVEARWRQGLDLLAASAVLIIEAAEMLGLKQLERVIGIADRVRAKVVLIGDPMRLGAMGGDTPFWSVLQATGVDIK